MNGLIGFYNLEEWFNSAFSEKQRQLLYDTFPACLTQGNFSSLYSFPVELLKIIDISNNNYRDNINDNEINDIFNCKKIIYFKAYSTYESVIIKKEELFIFLNLAISNFHFYKSFWDNTNEVKQLCKKCIEVSELIIPLYRERNEQLPQNLGYSELYRIERSEENWTTCLRLCQKARNEGWPGQWTRLINYCSNKIDESYSLIQDKDKPRNILTIQKIKALIQSSPVEPFLFYDNNKGKISDPSMIFTNLEVCIPSENQQVPRLYAFPAYINMIPEQRYEYLSWLQDITKPIGISYVFLFFYGLERLIFKKDYSEYNFEGDYGQIVPTIITPESNNQLFYFGILSIISLLRKNHTHYRFQELSMDSCIRSIIFRRDKTLLKKYLEYESKNSCCFTLLYYYSKNKEYPILNSREITGTAKFVGFTNDHYIKKDFNKFSDVLESILMEKTGHITFDLSTYSKFLEIKRNCRTYVTANPLIKYNYEYFDIFRNPKLSDFLYNLIKATHEKIKEQKIF